MIPKILHFIWVGGSENSFLDNMKTYKKHNPDWELKLWTDHNLPKLMNQKIYDSIPVPATKADLLRIELLYRYGGVYVDIDSICKRPIDFIEGRDIFFSTHNFHPKIEISCIGSIKEHTILGRVLEKLPAYWGRLVKKERGVLSVYCLYTFIRVNLKGEKFDMLPLEYNCLEEFSTKKTYIVQQKVNTFKPFVNKENKFTLEVF
jgi:hypothetical protein